MQLDLSEMTQLQAIFRELFKGYHLSRSEPECYAQLSTMQDQYRALFKAWASSWCATRAASITSCPSRWVRR